MLGTAYQLVTIKSRNRKRINECLKIIYTERNVRTDKVFKLNDPVIDVLEVLKLAAANLSSSSELEVLDIVERTASDYKMREILEKIWSRRQSIEKHI